MRVRPAVVLLLGLAACSSPGRAESYRWSVECPKAVDRAAEFRFTVRTAAEGGAEAPNVPYRFEITWPPGAGVPLRQAGRSGAAQPVHARVIPGPARLVILGADRDGALVKVAEAPFEVK